MFNYKPLAALSFILQVRLSSRSAFSFTRVDVTELMFVAAVAGCNSSLLWSFKPAQAWQFKVCIFARHVCATGVLLGFVVICCKEPRAEHMVTVAVIGLWGDICWVDIKFLKSSFFRPERKMLMKKTKHWMSLRIWDEAIASAVCSNAWNNL